MRRRLLVSSAVVACLALAPTAARADVGQFIADEAIDGPVTALGDLDVARDGTGAVAYVKPDGGVDHIFISRLDGGAWQAPERVDAGLPSPGSQPVVAAGNGGEVDVAFISGGALYTMVKPASGQPYTPPQLVTSSALNPSIDLSINDVAYLSFTVPTGGGGGDVVAARKDRKATTFNVIPASLDIDPTRQAGIGGGRSKVAVAADGVALVVWGEAGRVWVRRVFEQRLSAAPQDATVDAVGATPGVSADVPDVDVQDDSSFAWVVFRERFSDSPAGHLRAVARKLVGSQFDPGVIVDGLGGFPSADDVGSPRIDINGRGEGYAASAGTGTAFGAVLKDKVFNPAAPLGAGLGGNVLPVVATDENGDGLVAWQNADQTIHGRPYTNRRASRVVQGPQPDVALSAVAAGGPSDATDGLEASADRAGDIAVAFVQGPPGARGLRMSSFDRAPGAFRLSSGTSFRNVGATPLKWSQSFELWGPLTYTVEVDGQVAGRTNTTSLALPGLPDGAHRWRVIAGDRRGQITATPPRVLRQDGTAPRATARVSGTRRRGRPVRASRCARPTPTRPGGPHRASAAW